MPVSYPDLLPPVGDVGRGKDANVPRRGHAIITVLTLVLALLVRKRSETWAIIRGEQERE